MGPGVNMVITRVRTPLPIPVAALTARATASIIREASAANIRTSVNTQDDMIRTRSTVMTMGAVVSAETRGNAGDVMMTATKEITATNRTGTGRTRMQDRETGS